jgi:hypothetical protein
VKETFLAGKVFICIRYEEWDGEPDDSSPEEVLHGTASVQIDPPQNDAEDSQTTRAVP